MQKDEQIFESAILDREILSPEDLKQRYIYVDKLTREAEVNGLEELAAKSRNIRSQYAKKLKALGLTPG